MNEIKDMDDFLDFIKNDLGENIWIPLYKNLNKEDETEDGSIYSCLVEPSETAKAMESYGWDLLPGSGGPSLVTCGTEMWYEPNSSKFLPLIIYREFHGIREPYREISQELVLYLNLFHATESKRYLVDDDNGTEIDVIKYSNSEILIRKSFLFAFMAARQCNLLLFFENSRHKKNNSRYPDEHFNGEKISYTRFWDSSYVKSYDTFTRVLGKKLILCEPLNEENTSPFNTNKTYELFIIKGDSHDSLSYSCDPSLLANYFGKNKGSPHYLTPIFFKKEVLQKYYNASSEYEINDSSIHKIGFWTLRIDNNSTEHICVFLGDLGRDIPYSEQTYWKSFNLAPEEKEMSDTYFQRSMLGNFADAQSPDLRFKSTFLQFQENWYQKYNWYLFLPLNESDRHCFQTLHSLTSNEQSEFDSQILFLVKMTNDSINVQELKKIVSLDENGSIKLLAEFLKANGVVFDVSSFLGGLQGIRSTGVAHRRGSKYERTIEKLNIVDSDLKGALDNILDQMIVLLTEISVVLLNR